MLFQRIVFFFLIFFLFGLSVQAQNKLFDDFFFKMPKKKAILVIKENKKKFNNIKLGSNNSFILRKGSLAFEEDLLIHITMWSKNDLNPKTTEKKLHETVKYFVSKGFKIVHSQPEWSDPQIKDLSKPYLRLVHKEQKLLVEIEPRGQGDLYNVFLSIYDLNWFSDKLNGL